MACTGSGCGFAVHYRARAGNYIYTLTGMPVNKNTVITTICCALSSYMLVHSLSLGLAGAQRPNGERYKVSVNGVSRVFSPNSQQSPSVNCNWFACTENCEFCAPNSTLSFELLLCVRPMLGGALIAAVVACVTLVVPRKWLRDRSIVPPFAGAASLATAFAIIVFSVNLKPGLRILVDATVGFGTLGFLYCFLATIMLGFASVYSSKHAASTRKRSLALEQYYEFKRQNPRSNDS